MHSLKSQSTTLGMPQQNNPIAIWAKKLTKGCFFFLNMCTLHVLSRFVQKTSSFVHTGVACSCK